MLPLFLRQIRHPLGLRVWTIQLCLAVACILGSGPVTWAQDWIPNEGQWDAPVQMRADWAGGITWLEDQGMAVWVAGEGYDELWAH